MTESKLDREEERLLQVFKYHQLSKHSFRRSAPAPGFLDWSTQPDPFRRYREAELLLLPLMTCDETPAYDLLFERGAGKSKSVSLDSVSRFFYYSLAISAWKGQAQDFWALRVNPSSGNLHPTEAYLLCPPIPALSEKVALFHYSPKEHALERRAVFDESLWAELSRESSGTLLILGLTSIHWREAWKYGERAYRYCQLDLGHALAACSLSAAMLGWHLHLVEGVTDDQAAQLLGLDRIDEFDAAERETPGLLARLTRDADTPEMLAPSWAAKAARMAAAGNWYGQANSLSRRHCKWPAIELVSAAAGFEGALAHEHAPPAVTTSAFQQPPSSSTAGAGDLSAGQLVRQRRSALDMDRKTYLSRPDFYSIMRHLMPDWPGSPTHAVGWRARVHLLIFLHRVEDLVPGLYLLVRDARKLGQLKHDLKRAFRWQRPETYPEDLPLYLLEEGDVTDLAASLSCGQEIAADGVFSCAMIAEFEPVLRCDGPHWYRRLFWEAGLVGQTLYLEAEAKGVRGTGVGCFFDDPALDLIGLRGRRWQDLYHFTVGGPVDDKRLQTLPAYDPGKPDRCPLPKGARIS